jgi:hypothetical protein
MSALDEDRDGWVKVLIEKEFRSMAPQKPVTLGLTMGEPGSLAMDVEIETRSPMDAIRAMVLMAGEGGVTVKEVAEGLSMDKRTVLARVRGAERGGVEVVTGKKGTGVLASLVVGPDSRSEGANGHA